MDKCYQDGKYTWYQDIYQCGSCGYCLDSCSVYTTTQRESVSPRGKVLLLRKYEEGILTDPLPITERVYTCTLCGKCEDACPSKTKITRIIKTWRNNYPFNFKKLSSVVVSVLEKGNPYTFVQSEREKWYTGQDPDSSTAYFPGCTTSLMQPQMAEAFMTIMEGRMPLQVIDDVCCGSILSKTGFEEEAQKIMKKNIDYFKERGIKTVITSCAGCYSFFQEYPFSVKVLHTSQVISQIVPELQSQSFQTTYHDPCHLVKNSLTTQPRYVLKELSEYTEKDSQSCCGAGGGMLLNLRELADDVCRNMLKGSDPSNTLVTACPFCLYHMKRNSFHRILSLEEVVASCIP
ncbi:MAG: (Fe-S)-binding protein [Theionarchaea archaeon]|nr:(Fe-S)-binding protein [Theionarchaea archaeon]